MRGFFLTGLFGPTVGLSFPTETVVGVSAIFFCFQIFIFSSCRADEQLSYRACVEKFFYTDNVGKR